MDANIYYVLEENVVATITLPELVIYFALYINSRSVGTILFPVKMHLIAWYWLGGQLFFLCLLNWNFFYLPLYLMRSLTSNLISP